MKKNILKSILYLLSFIFFIGLLGTSFSKESQTDNTGVKNSQSAYSRIAPYINNDTFLVARIDLSTLDLDEFFESIDELCVNSLKERNFDRNGVNRTNREIRKSLDIVKKDFASFVELRDELKVKEAFLLVQNQQKCSFRLIFPIKDQEARDQFKAALEKKCHYEYADIPNAVCIIPSSKEDEDVYRNFKVEVNQDLKELYSQNSGSFFSLYCAHFRFNSIKFQYPEAERTQIESKLSACKELGAPLDAFDLYFRKATIVGDPNALVFKIRVDFSTAERADEVCNGFQAYIEKQIEALYKEKIKKQDSPIRKKYNIDALQRELSKALLVKFFSQRTDNSLSFEWSPVSKTVAGSPLGFFIYTKLLNQFLGNDASNSVSE